MDGTKIIVLVGAIAVANAAMAVINPFSPQLALSTVPKVTTVSTASVTPVRTVVRVPLALPPIIVIVRSGFTLPPPDGTPMSIGLLPPPPPPPAR